MIVEEKPESDDPLLKVAFETIDAKKAAQQDQQPSLPSPHLVGDDGHDDATGTTTTTARGAQDDDGGVDNLASLLTTKNDKLHRKNLRDLGYSDKIVEKLSPYQAYWLHRYHIYNHADEIYHPEQQQPAAVPHTAQSDSKK